MAATKNNPIIFYDLTGKDGISWSPNTYKTRITLNHKCLPYRVVKLSFPEIEEKYKELKLPPPYILPLIVDPSSDPSAKPTYVSDSFKIAAYLDDKYPTPHYPAVFPPGTRALQNIILTQYFPLVAIQLSPLIQPNIPARLDERGADYWHRNRGHRFPRLPDEVATQKWQDVAQKWDAFGRCFDVNEDTAEAGPFVMGSQVTFVDFAIGGVFHFFHQIEGKDSPRLNDMMEWQGGRWRVLRDRILAIERNSSELI